MLKIYPFIIIIILSLFSCTNEEDVKLIKSDFNDCDRTYNPHKLKNRISQITSNAGITYITVNFTENCCIPFNPEIEFKDSILTLFPYRNLTDTIAICDCNCCFSINYEITGLEDKDYDIYFHGRKIEYSEEHYDTVQPTFIIHRGEKINYINKYGLKEGIWKVFYDSLVVKNIKKYPDDLFYWGAQPEWEKEYLETGELIYYSRKDTTEEWFKDGTIKSQKYNYSIGDTSFESVFKRRDNRRLKERYLKRRYRILDTSEFDLDYKDSIFIYDYKYNERYYANGNLEYIETKHKSLKFYENGVIKRKCFYGKVPGVKNQGDLESLLSFEYDENGNLKEVSLRREEVVDNGTAFTTRWYDWKWDEKGNLNESPEDWDEEYPWEKLDEKNLIPENYKLK